MEKCGSDIRQSAGRHWTILLRRIGFSPVYISQQLLKTVKCSDLTELEQLVHHEDVLQLRGKAEPFAAARTADTRFSPS